MKVFLITLLAALFWTATPVSAAPLLDGGGPATGCLSEWAVGAGFANGEFPVGYPNSDGLTFCLNGGWVNRLEFISIMGNEPEFYYSAIPKVTEPTQEVLAPATQQVVEFQAAPDNTSVGEENGQDYGWMGYAFLAVFFIVILLAKTFLFRGR